MFCVVGSLWGVFFYRIARLYSVYVLEDSMHTKAYSKVPGLSR